MKLVCLDLEGVLTPEIWMAFADAVNIPELRRTTRDEPDYGKLMSFRLDILNKNKLRLPDIQNVIAALEPLPGAVDFLNELRAKSQVIILSDTFEQFVKPLMQKLSSPVIFCNTLVSEKSGEITGWKLRQENGKKNAVKALKSCNIEIFAAGDSFNDLAMIAEANYGCLFRAPESIKKQNSGFKCVNSYEDLLKEIDVFLNW
ncbi:MAG: bifunctional phosphoserine phosphatase/homoserine phosphotransferase ThrH [Spirochaetaceae bacterium]|jgi:phosphoserine/homoserine phosphotransferase|nr:bifunctional phosphoserine phosphatase/homoserine phosphotransferase ThrH [Spirochaetaceae bacterium]